MKFKFKVGDRVRAKLEKEYMGVCNGDLGTITENSPCPFVSWDKLNGGTIALDEEELELAEYTYEDLKKSPIGTKITFENGTVLVKDDDGNYSNKKRWRDDSDLKELKDRVNTLGKIIKIEEPTYQTVYESKVEILDEVEKRYLRGVIRPFKDKVKYIEKCKSVTYEDDSYICVQIKNASSITLPYFESKTMYKNMEDDKKYTLEELGL